MRVLFVCVPGATHFHGFVPLAWALQLAGHEVRVACRPSDLDAVAGCGLPTVRVGRDADVIAPFAGAADALVDDALVDDVVALARAWRPHLIGYEPAAYAAPVAAAVVGVPSVRVPAGPDTEPRDAHVAGAALRPVLDRFGLDTLDPLGTLTVDPCPPSLRLASPVTRRTMRYVPFDGPGAMPVSLFEPARQPRVCLTWGTPAAEVADPSASPLPYAVRAAAELDVEVVVVAEPGTEAAATAELDPAAVEAAGLPERTRVVAGVPLHALLPTCVAVVHQGAARAILTAAACGVPQVVVPELPDQAGTARRLADTGAGLVCWPRGPHGDALRSEVRETLGALLGDRDRYAEAAARLRKEIEAQPTPAELVPALAELAGRGAR